LCAAAARSRRPPAGESGLANPEIGFRLISTAFQPGVAELLSLAGKTCAEAKNVLKFPTQYMGGFAAERPPLTLALICNGGNGD
jgi:hypothetical protein